jgi:IS30 family transposase
VGARYDHLTLDERRLIYRLREARLGVPRIAERLGRHRSTIYRELRRNWHRDGEIREMNGYYPTVAHGAAARRRYRLGKLQQNSTLATLVVERLNLAWSPEQIAGRLRLDKPHGATICHETIYRFVYGPQGRADALYRLLPSRRRRRRARYARKPKGLFIPEENTIRRRPEGINERVALGHWECDLVGFRQVFGQHKLTTLVERVSRYVILARNPSRHSAGVMAGIETGLTALPPEWRRSITFDRGTEFTGYAMLKARLGLQSYFCAPQAPWQKKARWRTPTVASAASCPWRPIWPRRLMLN